MQSITRVFLVAAGSLLCLPSAPAAAQPRPVESGAMVLLVGGVKRVQSATKTPIRAIRIDNEQIARVRQQVKDGVALIEGVAPGTTRLTVTDGDGKVIVRSLVVRSDQLLIAVGETVRLQMTTGRPIKEVLIQRPTIVRVEVMATDPTTVLITGLAPGTSRITLTDIDGRAEDHHLGRPPAKR